MEIRVLFVLGSLVAGGSERQVVESLKSLDRKRFRPSLYTVYRQGDLLKEIPADSPVFSYWDLHRYPRLNLPGLISRRQSYHLASVLAEQQIDVVCDRNFEMTLLASAACTVRPTRRISFISSDPARDLAENAGRFGWMKRRFLRRAYRQAHRVVCVSTGVAQAVREFYGLPPEKIATICNFVDFARVDRLAIEFRPPFDPNQFHIVSVGRLHPAKGHRFLVEAMDDLVHARGLRQVVAWIVGRGPLHEELTADVAKRKLQDHVRFTGFQPNPLPYMKHANLFCLTSVYEGMPNSLVEAMGCGTPVLSFDCPSGPAEILGGGRYGRLIPAQDRQALADSIADAITRYADWQKKTDEAREFVRREYSSQTGMAALERLLETVLTE